MPPKKVKKGKKGGDDDEEYWAAKEAALASPAPEPEAEEEEGGGGLMSRIRKGKKKRNTFADLDAGGDDVDDEPKPAGIEETRPNLDDEWPEEDVKPKKGKKGKKAKAQKVEESEDEDEPKPAGIEETRANLDDEWPEEDVKPKKGKKGKKAKAQKEESDDEVPEPEVEEKAAPVKEQKVVQAQPEPEAANDDGEDEGPKILTKKEKEKLKKEKEKEKKKAQAAAKRAAAGDAAPSPSTPAPVAESAPPPSGADAEADDAEGDEHDADDATAADKKKKKKKKAAAKAEPTPAPAAKGKKVPAHILAMQAAVAEKKRIEEEAAAAEAERQRLLQEEDERIAKEEADEQAKKDAKKAKEKEKQQRLKAEGKLLTPAQKREKAVAEARKQAMLNAGVKVAGLQQGAGSGSGDKKKPVFNKKKVQPKAPAADKSSAPASPVVETPTPAPAPAEPEKKEESEDDWDKSDDDAEAVEKLVSGVDGMKVAESEDDWDKSDTETATPKPAASPTTAAVAKTDKPAAAPAPAPAKSTAAPAPAPKATPAATKPVANGKPAAEEEESDDESDDDSEEDSSDEESDSSVDSEDERIEAGLQKVVKRREAAAKASEGSNELRSPICCILGHVDHGKTRLLDKIRQTSVAEGEAGGITQQIGATFFPADAIIAKSSIVNTDNYEVKIPGLLIIDTPGHEAFANLRTRGSSLCNIAILVVDITQSFQRQTFESLELLKKGKTPFIVALNKIDKLYGWEATPNNGFRESLAKQSKSVKSEFEDRLREVKLRLSEQGLNSEIFDENKKLGSVVSLVPTSAFTGEGIPDMLLLLAKLTQERMNKSLMYISDLSCTILEVKNVEGMGTTIDVILSNGHLKYGDTIVLCGTDGPIVTKVRGLLTPQPMRELRIKSAFVKHDEVKAALGVKIYAPGLEKAIAGARLFVAEDEDEEAYFKDICMDDLATLERFTVGAKGKGVYVQASTLGALEALLTFLQSNKVPVFDFGVGPVFSKTIRGHVLMTERAPEYACVLAFDVPIDPDAQALAKKEGLKIFTAPVIYHLFDAFQKYLAEVIEARKRDAMGDAVWPVRLSIIQAFAHRDPIILGCDIIEGSLRVGTPVGVVRIDKATKQREIIKLGKITSLEKEHKSVNLVKKRDVGGGIAVKIERAPYETARLYGRHFDDKDEVVSLISRQSIDTLKNVFRDQVEKDEWLMIRKMKEEQGVQ